MARAAQSTKLPPELLSEDEIRALIRACSKRGSAGIRNAALIALMWRTGLRIAEALALMPRDVDLERGTVRVRHGKGDRSRTVGIDDQAGALVARWQDRRTQLGLNGRHLLFCTLKGGEIDQSYVRHALRRLRDRSGIDRRAHAHALRHAHAAELARENVPLNIVRDVLGHASIATTDVYLRGIAPEDVIRTQRSRTWEL